MARDWHSFEAAAAPLLNAVGLHFATDGYTPSAAATPVIFSRGGTSRVSATLRILPLL